MAKEAESAFSSMMDLKRSYDAAKAAREKEAATVVRPTPNLDGTHDHLSDFSGGWDAGHVVLPEDKYGP